MIMLKQERMPYAAFMIWFSLSESLKRKGAEYFLLGCTELSTLASIPDFCHTFNYVDSSLELALAAISQCGYEIKKSL